MFWKGCVPVLTALAAGWMAAACADREKVSDFAAPTALRADSIAIHQIIKPERWTTGNDKAIILQGFGADSLFYVYSMPDFRFLYTWGARGEGPGEFPRGAKLDDMYYGDVDSLLIEERNTLRAYRADDAGFELLHERPVPRSKLFVTRYSLPYGFTGERKAPSQEKEVEYFYVRRIGDQAGVTDSLRLNTRTETQYAQSGHAYQQRQFNPASPVVRGHRLAFVYRHIRHVDFYDLSPEGRLTPVASVGDPVDDDALARIQHSQDDPSWWAGSMTATDEYLYVLWGKSGEAPELPVVCVYDWNGREVRAYRLEKQATDILVARDDSRLYTRNGYEDFDQVYVYDISE